MEMLRIVDKREREKSANILKFYNLCCVEFYLLAGWGTRKRHSYSRLGNLDFAIFFFLTLCMGLQIYTRFFCCYREDNVPQLQDVSLYLKRKYICLWYYLQSANNYRKHTQ